ncbi:hypothetical protein DPMN_078186, partial [Dreissena polymorpha]
EFLIYRIEQPARRVGQPTRPCDDHTYAKVKEVTGITDRKLIDEAVNSCRNPEGKYEVAEVISFLIADEKRQKGGKRGSGITVVREDEADAVGHQTVNLNKNAKTGGVIDLTSVSDTNESDDIQKAIAASLQDSSGPYVQESSAGILGGQVSREEQDISRVLEQSLIESKAGTKRKRGDIWFVDPLNPHERKRVDSWPIGLKNVGNTCWFSAVIQSLFHLKRFRHLVLTYQPNKDVQGRSEVKRNLRFMCELRHLFALMVGSRRKYVDPSRAVDILKEAFTSSVASSSSVSDSQQDVSEFQHKLLDWLEDAFKAASRPSSPEEGAEKAEKECLPGADNPMVDLFYGQFRAEGVNEGKDFCNEETFGQFPLQVNGFRDIHESLEAATALREIETVSSQTAMKSGQELWFTRLPPVLTFELSRFQFNQQFGRPEKIHNKIEFPQVIYMDRYMDCNRKQTRERRERAKKLKEELLALQGRLDKFINYGSGNKRFPLQDVLLYALEFAKTRPEGPPRKVATTATVTTDVEMECLSPNTSSSMMVDSPMKSPSDSSMSTVTSPQGHSSPESTKGNRSNAIVLSNQSVTGIHGNIEDSPSSSSQSATSVPDSSAVPSLMLINSESSSNSFNLPDVSMVAESRSSPMIVEEEVSTPHPKHVSDNELLVLQDCLHRWRTEVENDVKELQDGISLLESSINKMYSDESMTQHPYHLHAVLVHEGQAASGHYWAYIHDAGTDKWLKFNDIAVSDASWEELEKECVGGYHNASAYCLMYIDKRRIDEDSMSGNQSACISQDLENLPDDLKELVTNDNQQFSDEIERWDREAARKAAGGGDTDVAVISEQKPALPVPAVTSTSNSSTQTMQARQPVNYASIHATLAVEETRKSFKKLIGDLPSPETLDPPRLLEKFLDLELKRTEEITKELPKLLPTRDPRLQHIVVYMQHCKCHHNHIMYMLLEQVAEGFSETAEMIGAKKVQQCAAAMIKRQREEKQESNVAMEHHLQIWHETYQKFLKTALLFVKGIIFYFDEKHLQSLPYLLHAHLLTLDLTKKHPNCGLTNPKILAFFLRQTLLHLNDTLTSQFEEKVDVVDILGSVISNVLPCMQTVIDIGSSEDVAAIEEIREKWCSYLGQEIDSNKAELLQDFLSKLFEPPYDLKLPSMPRIGSESFYQLHKQFTQVMEKAVEYGYVEKALKGS